MVGTIFRRNSTTTSEASTMPNVAFQALPIKEESGTTYTIVESSDYSIIMTNVAARTVTLPEAPTDGVSFSIADGAGTASSASISIVTQGSDVFGEGGTSYEVNADYASVVIRYDADTAKYWIE